jgi:hypothetical protein
MFEANLRDERFLPFKGAGAESTWKLELPVRFRQFDYDTILKTSGFCVNSSWRGNGRARLIQIFLLFVSTYAGRTPEWPE